jgi:hypothetical protein
MHGILPQEVSTSVAEKSENLDSGGKSELRFEFKQSALEHLATGLVHWNTGVDADFAAGFDDGTKDDVLGNLRIASEFVGKKLHELLRAAKRFARGDMGFRLESDDHLSFVSSLGIGF